jgi:hypothetical protein
MVLFGLVVVSLPAVAAAAAWIPAAQPHQASCRWQNIGTSSTQLFHMGLALDSDANKAYVYGGLNEQLATQSRVEEIDLSAAMLDATVRSVSAGAARDLFGATAAYRARGDQADGSAIYYFGGIGDPTSGNATSDIQRYVTKTARWETVSLGGFLPRGFAAAAYDPDHDLIWVLGGTASCSITEVVAGQSCVVQNRPVQYLSFDPATGAPKAFTTLAGATAGFYAHSAVYDSVAKRLLIFGGTNDIRRGSSDVWQLDLSNSDPATARLTRLTTAGAGPSIYFHSASFDPIRNRMVVYGGLRQNFMQSSESLETGTWALDLTAVPSPSWVNLSPQGTPGDRVAGGMVYDQRHDAAIQVLGRKKITISGGNASASAQRPIFGLTCASIAQETATATLMATATSTAPVTGTVAATATGMATGTMTITATAGTPTATATLGSATATMTATMTVEPTLTAPATPTPSPTRTPLPSATMTPAPPTVPPTAGTPAPEPEVCPDLERMVPQPAIDNALANPATVQGWLMLCNPNVPPSIWNTYRRYLGLQNSGKPYNPLFNSVIYKCGCP